MYASSRRNKILEIITELNTVSVNEILAQFPVSPATIRKDLTYLETAGMIKRTRGEVHLVEYPQVMPFQARSEVFNENKRAIAKKAVEFINDGETIILDSGTTTFEMAKMLDHIKELTVITHSVPICYHLANKSITVQMSGGILQSSSFSLVGPDAENFFSSIEVNKIFLAASGVRGTVGLTIASPFEASVKRQMIKAAKTVYAVFDHRKLDAVCMNLFATFEEIDYIITDMPIKDDALLQRFKELGIEIIYTDES